MKSVLFIVFFGISTQLYSNVIDTTIFNSDFEKEIFFKLIDSSDIEPVELFLAINYSDNNAQIKARINGLTDYLDKTLANQKKAKKQLSIIYKAVHERFLKLYKADKFFNDIFSTGEFNCVSASALYSLVLEKLNFNYYIKETPTHVYLIADPNNLNFKIETTLPTNGLVQFDSKLQKDYVEYLHKNKIISDYDMESKSINELFAENYSNDVTINLQQLAGLQYFNDGIFKYEKENFKEALKSFEKAHFLYPSNSVKYMYSLTLSQSLNLERQNKDYSPQLLFKYLSLNKSNPTAILQGEDYFNEISNDLIVNNSEIKKYEEYFDVFRKNEIDSTINDKLHQVYYFHVSYYYYGNFNYSLALHNLEKSYQSNPNNLNVKRLILEVSNRYLIVDADHESKLDSIDLYFKKFPFLENDKTLNNFYAYCLTRTIEKYFNDYNPDKGIKYFNELEQLINKGTKLTYDNRFIESAYGIVASYYVRNQEYNAAETLLQKGISLIPSSVELKNRLNTLKASKGDLYTYINNSNAPSLEYSNALLKVKKDKNAINEGVNKYLKRKWYTKTIFEEGIAYNVPSDEEIRFSLNSDKTLDISMDGEVEKGTWSYNKNDCTLNLNVSDEEGVLCIIITSITAGDLEGVMYFDNDYSDSYKTIFRSFK